MAGITSADIAGALKVAKLETQFIIQSNAVLQNYVRLSREAVKTVSIPVFNPSASVEAPAENVAATVLDLTGTTVDVTASRKAITTDLSVIASLGSAENMGLAIGKWFGAKMVEKINQDIFALFDGFSTAVGTSNVDITAALIQQARSVLVKANAPTPHILAITPHVEEDLVAELSDTSGAGYILANTILTEGTVKKIFGCEVVVVSDLAAGTSAGQKDAADIKCGLFNPEAIAMNIMRDFEIEAWYNPRKGSFELTGDMYYGVAELHDSFGCELLVDNKD